MTLPCVIAGFFFCFFRQQPDHKRRSIRAFTVRTSLLVGCAAR